MVSVGTVRIVTLVVCVAGIAGMIVTSILNHNGAAVTFGLVTAVAVLCSMVAKSVAADTTRRLSRLPPPAVETGRGEGPAETVSIGAAAPAPAPAPAPASASASAGPGAADTEELAAAVEGQVQVVVSGGADEAAVRRLVGEAVRLGRNLAADGPPKRPH